ncbi:MAG: class I SAM-dependent methyltransferase [Bacteroidota bacterium]
METKCKICGTQEESRIIGRPVLNKNFPRAAEKNYKIVQCRNCRFYYVTPEIDLSQEEWKQLYENDYFAAANISEWQIILRASERKKRFKTIISELKTEKGKFLDIGCGEGFVLKEAEKNGFEPYGVDIAYNLAPYFSHFNFFKGNIFEGKFPDEYFSVIYMDSVLEHMLKPMETLHELKRIIKPGGVLLLIVPNEDSLENAFIRLLYSITLQSGKYGKIKPLVTPYHIQGFNGNSLRTALNKCSFSKISIKGFGGNYTFWKAKKIGTKPYFQALLTFPVGLLSIALKKQIQLMALSVK